MSDREKARDLGNQSAALARSIADVLNDTLDALEAAEAALAEARRERDEYHRALKDAVASRSEILRNGYVLRQAERAERDALAEALRQILNPRTGPTGFLSIQHGGTGFPQEIARAALAAVSPQGNPEA